MAYDYEVNQMGKEKYFICTRCGDLITRTKLLSDVAAGSSGMCYCEFVVPVWDEKSNTIEKVSTRTYIAYEKIKKKWYHILSSEPNEVLRLLMFDQIPKNKR